MCPNEPKVYCDFCKRSELLSIAIDEGWEPSYFVGEHETGGPCCPECFPKFLRISEDGPAELVVRPCPVKDVRRVQTALRADRNGVLTGYEAYTVLRECGVTERRALAMLFGGKD